MCVARTPYNVTGNAWLYLAIKKTKKTLPFFHIIRASPLACTEAVLIFWPFCVRLDASDVVNFQNSIQSKGERGGGNWLIQACQILYEYLHASMLNLTWQAQQIYQARSYSRRSECGFIRVCVYLLKAITANWNWAAWKLLVQDCSEVVRRGLDGYGYVSSTRP